MIIAIWAEAQNHVIGYQQQLPWHIPDEMRHFKITTMHHSLFMGRKTFARIPGNKLTHRHLYVLTHDLTHHTSNSDVTFLTANNLAKLLSQFRSNHHKHLFIAGGASIYRLLWSECEQLIVSLIKGSFLGDTFFPSVDWSLFQAIKTKNHALFTITYYNRKD